MATPMPVGVTTTHDVKKILEALEKGPQSRNDLLFQIGLSGPELVKVIHEMKGYGYVVAQDVDGSMGSKLTKYFLTPAGRNLWYQISPPPKSDKKNKGYKHIHGVVGKIDYSKPLTGMKAKVYEAMTRPQMTGEEIANACNMADVQPVWNTLTQLLELDIVEYIEKRNAKGRMCRHYTRKRDMRLQDEEEMPPPPKPVLSAYDRGHPIVESVIKAATPAASDAPKTVEAAVDELLQQYPMDEVVIALNVKLVDEYQTYQDLKRRFLNAAVNAGHQPRK